MAGLHVLWSRRRSIREDLGSIDDTIVLDPDGDDASGLSSEVVSSESDADPVPLAAPDTVHAEGAKFSVFDFGDGTSDAYAQIDADHSNIQNAQSISTDVQQIPMLELSPVRRLLPPDAPTAVLPPQMEASKNFARNFSGSTESQWSSESDEFESEDERRMPLPPTGRGLITDYAPHITANDYAEAHAHEAARGAGRQGKGYGFKSREAALTLDWRTTVMVMSLRQFTTQDQFAHFVKQHGFFEKCDFIYMPTCIHQRATMGYGFINFLDVSSAAQFVTLCEACGLQWSPARIQGSQALMANLQKRLMKIRNPKLLPIFPLRCDDNRDARKSR